MLLALQASAVETSPTEVKLNCIDIVSLKYIAYNFIYFLIFQGLIEFFHKCFRICSDPAQRYTAEEIREWFNIRLIKCGQKPWPKESPKWALTKDKLGLRFIMWQRKD